MTIDTAFNFATLLTCGVTLATVSYNMGLAKSSIDELKTSINRLINQHTEHEKELTAIKISIAKGE